MINVDYLFAKAISETLDAVILLVPEYRVLDVSSQSTLQQISDQLRYTILNGAVLYTSRTRTDGESTIA